MARPRPQRKKHAGAAETELAYEFSDHNKNGLGCNIDLLSCIVILPDLSYKLALTVICFGSARRADIQKTIIGICAGDIS